jgi:molecular chaperone DnaK
MAHRVIGIDLGTTSSCVAAIVNGTPMVIPNRGGYKTTPSMVAIAENGRRLIGHIAKRQAITNAENTLHAVKRLMGRKLHGPGGELARQKLPYTLVEGPGGELRIKLHDRVYTAPEISAFILQELKLIAEEHLGEEVTQAVITVPASWSDAQRQATKDAGRIAGLEVLRILNEPTAAALAYGFGKNIERRVAVYDLGGGSFDISVLDVAEGSFTVIASSGDAFLGGEEFDRRIIDWLADAFRAEHGVDLRQDRMALQRLKDVAERAKCELSSSSEADINLPFIYTQKSGPLHLVTTLSRQKLEELTADLIDRTIATCKRTLDDAGLHKSEIEDVILVGGQTRMPRVQERVAQAFGMEPCKGVHPEEVVALGAAIQGMALSSRPDVVLHEVTPTSLGIMIVGGYVHRLVPKGAPLPAQASHIFTTTKDNQTSVKILVVQGESERAEENELLGEFVLTGLRKAARGELEVEVTFEISAEGMVGVSARDVDTGVEQRITLSTPSRTGGAGGQSDDDLERMLNSSGSLRLDPRSAEELSRQRALAQQLMAEIERLYPRVDEAMSGSSFGKDAVKKARTVLDRARAALSGTDEGALQEATDALSRTLNMFRAVVSKMGAG